MAVVWIKEDELPPRARFTDRSLREYTRGFKVKVDAKTDGPAVVLSALGIPRLGSQYITATEVDLGARCVRVEHFETETPYLRRVEAEYSSQSPDPLQQVENPLLRPAEVDYSGQKYTKPFDRDVNGKPLVNSFGKPFDPPLERDDTRMVLIITRNEPVFLGAVADLYQDTVNSDPFFGRPADSWKCEPFKARLAYENGISFVVVTYEFHFRKEGWMYEVLDAGRCGYNSSGKVDVFKDAEGVPLTDPIPLNGKGGKMADTTTTLEEDCTAADATIKVGNTLIWPKVGDGKPDLFIKIDDEILKVAEIGMFTFTVERGVQGSTAAAHTASVGGDKKVKMEPYHLKFQGYELRPFSALLLP